MKLIIAGGRDYHLTSEDYRFLNTLRDDVKEVVCGGASGADTYGRHWAKENDIPVKMFPANWKEHGKAAGPIRNRQMAKYADAAVLFPGGRGTDNMYTMAIENDIKVFDKRDPNGQTDTPSQS